MTDGLKDRHRAAIIATIAANERVERAVLFGSRATGTHSASSDVDIALIGDGLTLTDHACLAVALDDIPMAQKIDLVLYDSIQDEILKRNIRHQSVEWYARSIQGRANRSTSRDARTWPLMSLRQAGVSLIDCEHRTPPATDDGYPYVGIPQIKNGRVDLDSARPIAEEHYREWTRKVKPEPFDVVLSRRCNPGETGFVSLGLGEFAVGQNLVLLRSDGEKVLKPFLRWLSRGPEWWYQVGKYVNAGAVFDSLKCADIPEFQLPIPPLSEQHAIAHILGTLDDKIDLNRSMNATLEAMARALFKSWFVDFEPVRAKVEARETGLPTEVADLFPDRLVDSESGEVPMGWDTGVLADAVEIHSGGTPRTSVNHYWNGDIPWYTPKDAPVPSDVFVVATEKTITQAGVENSSTIVLPAGTTVISARGTVGRLACLGVPMAMNQTCYGIRGAVAYQGHDYFIYWLIRSTVEELRSRTHGTVFDTITRQTFASVNLPLPPVSVVKEFEFAVLPIMGRILRNLYEVGALTALRDTLLPELISGKLRLLGQQRPIMDDACPVAGGTLET